MKTYFKKICTKCGGIIKKSEKEVNHQEVDQSQEVCPSCGATSNKIWFSNPKLQK